MADKNATQPEKKSGGLAGLLKKLNIVEDDGKTTETVKQVATNQPAQSATPQTTIFTTTVGATGQSQQIIGQYDEKIFGLLAKAIETNNIPGNDYLELKQSINNMKAVQISEEAKIQAAYATLASQGGSFNKNSLMSSIDFYKGILLKEAEKFESALTKQAETDIGQKQQMIDKINQEIKEAGEQIQKLTQAINEKQQILSETAKTLETSKLELTQTTANFEKTLQIFNQNLDEDKQKIDKCISQ